MLIAVPDCCMACMGLVARVLLADGRVRDREMMGNGGVAMSGTREAVADKKEESSMTLGMWLDGWDS